MGGYTCRGICSRYKAIKGQHEGRYDNDQVRCQICTIFIKWEGRDCPCCKVRLRKKPRSRKYKERLEQKIKEKQLENPIEVSNKSFKVQTK